MNALSRYLVNFQLTKVKLALLVSFSSLVFLQFLTGFRNFEDYLIVLVYALFLNDLYLKIKKPEQLFYQDERIKRSVMSYIFLALIVFPFFLDAFNVSNLSRLFLFKLGFVLWAQVFLLDAFIHYRQTNSKQWLLITNMAVFFIVIGAFAI